MNASPEPRADTPPALAEAPAPPPMPPRQPPRRATVRFLLRHPAHLLALGFGSGLAPKAPGTVGTLWAWASFAALNAWLNPLQWAVLLVLGLGFGWLACTLTAQHLRVADPGCIVWDEVLAFWAVLWVINPAPWWAQATAFALFRFFDAAKPGPVGWADRHYKLRPGEAIGLRQGWGILFDDLVAAGCTLLVLALIVRLAA